eukprot:TRINITY_DN3734_c0_g1_i1.p1 TRINITY_DN3734_c0_g1~~TRINITY_DN3734_c0_g1_i1.p1  ORF type:complete len:367 (+),score=93.23 TRINITY_DN3734_c0_g1_i1:85-1185(+)
MEDPSLITEVLQQLQRGGVENNLRWKNPEDFVAPSPNNLPHPVKRQQVPKACSNCRKMHSGCDVERPCKRCIQNGLESTCIDVPRKKRVSKKKQKLEATTSEVTNLVSRGEPTRFWDDTYNEIFGDIVPALTQIPNINSSNSNNTQQQQIEVFNPYSYEPDPLILSGLDTSVQSNNVMSLFNPSPPQQQQQQSPNNSLSADSLNFLVQQIKELSESNKNLESKLFTANQELTHLRTTNTMQQTNQKALTTIGGWNNFTPQSELAISVWRPVGEPVGGCTKNVLIECNDKFVSMLGYSMDTLKDDFVCSNMIRKQDVCSNGGRDWPKRTQIVTAYGLKEVFITITPVTDQMTGTAKLYLLYLLEVHS